MKALVSIGFVAVLMIVGVSITIYANRNNVGASLFRVTADQLIYQQDPRTGLCFAQGPKLLASVPCSEEVKRLLEK
jgi:hypothetical protein